MVAQAADYNGQIARGEDVISRIIYASKGNNLAEMQGLVVGTINRLLEAACQQAGTLPTQVTKVAIAGNTTMMHLFLAIPPEPIRLAPFVPVSQPDPHASPRPTWAWNCNPQRRGRLPAGRGQLRRRGHQRGRV